MYGLLTDLYELTMAAGYFQSGKAADRATFELSIRRLPAGRSYVILAGIEQAIEYLEGLSLDGDEIRYLRGLPALSGAPEGFWRSLEEFRFTGDLWAVEEGEPVFAEEPVLRVTAPLPEAQIPETYLLAMISFQSLIATKASIIAQAARGRSVVEFGTRRAHSPQAGVLGARAAYIGGCTGTSNVEAGRRFGIPVFGTAAHSWTLAFDSEIEAFTELQKLLGQDTVYLVDTYDVEKGVRNAVAVGRPFFGIRLDSGDLDGQSRLARRILDEAGYSRVKIMASGDLDEHKIARLLDAGAPIDLFGVGTELATSADAPAMGSIYKLVEIESNGQVRRAAKFSAEKASLPGTKQVFRFADRDVVGLAEENFPGATPLLKPCILGGKRTAPPADLEAARRRARRENLASRPVIPSEALVSLTERVRKATL